MPALVCSQCGTVAQPGAEFCPKCLGPVQPAAAAPAEAGPAPVEAVAPVAGAAQVPKPPAVACPRHPEREVLGTCARCGGFFCAACLPGGALETENALCPDCEAGRKVRELPEQERKAFRVAGISMLLFTLAVLALILVGVGVELGDPRYSAFQSAVVLLFAVALHLPLAVCAVLTWWAHLRVAGWLGLLIECAAIVFVFATGGVSLYVIFLCGAAIVTAVQLLQIGALRQEARRKPATESTEPVSRG